MAERTRGSFRAKYAGRCLLCDGAIEEGEWIVMDEDSGQYVHTACQQEREDD